MKEIILIGGGGHCHSCIDIIEQEKIYQIRGIVLASLENSIPILKYPVIGTDEDVPKLLKQTKNILICIGQIKNFKIRKTYFEFLKNLGANFPIIKSPNAYCSRHANLGKGTILMHHALVNSNAQIGFNCIINSKSLIEHDTIVEDHCHISTGAIVNGAAKIGMGSFVGSGSVIKEGVEIGKGVIIGAGKTVIKNVSDGTIIK
jgi:sugar O-acyltransferase (sialic acid O-acetyltransferase NeuD family)